MRSSPLWQLVAAEYVLGTLGGPARRRFERLRAEDPDLDAAATAWETRLSGLALRLDPVPPSPAVWTAIERRIDALEAPRPRAEPARRRPPRWENLGFWRGFGLAAAGLAACLLLFVAVGVLQVPGPVPTGPSHIAVLSDESQAPSWIVNVDRAAGTVDVRPVAQVSLAADRALELWLVPSDGNPLSLGLITADARAELRLAEAAGDALPSAAALAVSLEPAGGSPTGLPTGPVLYQGTLVAAR